LPFGLSMFLVNVYDRVDILMLTAMTSASDVGLYAAAYKLLSLTNLVPMILVTALFPALSREAVLGSAEAARIFTKGLKYLTFLALPLIAGAMVLAEELVVFMFGAEFQKAAPALQILSWVSGILFVNIFLATLLTAANHQKKLVYVQICGLITNISLNLILIPKYSFVGAALATLATEGLVLTLCLLFAMIRITRLLELSFIPKALLATAGMIAFCQFAREYNFLLVLAGATVVYFVLLYAVNGFRFAELLLTRAEAKG
jgi:O-antigen/teichoic acid export membrane protein